MTADALPPHASKCTLAFAKVSMKPSRWMVARICSLPGEMVKGTLACMPAHGKWTAFSCALNCILHVDHVNELYILSSLKLLA